MMKDPDRLRASSAPRDTREKGSPEWCYQTTNLLKMSWQSMTLDEKAIREYVVELRAFKAWLKIPVGAPYGTEEAMLEGELGITEPIDKLLDKRIAYRELMEKKVKRAHELYEQGWTQQQIADELGVSQPTVNAYLALSENPVATQKTDKLKRDQSKRVVMVPGTSPAGAAKRIHDELGEDFARQLKEHL